MTLKRLRRELTQAEWLDWIAFFEAREAHQAKARTKAEQDAKQTTRRGKR